MPDQAHNPDKSAELEALRSEIDAADAVLLPAFIRRMQTALRVADCKFEAGAPVNRPGREHVILDGI
ncbi:MAG: chorismate mutase [Lentisphaeria bacterium]|nr:chorismate mutase [Lentisphaeria bacterium]